MLFVLTLKLNHHSKSNLCLFAVTVPRSILVQLLTIPKLSARFSSQ